MCGSKAYLYVRHLQAKGVVVHVACHTEAIRLHNLPYQGVTNLGRQLLPNFLRLPLAHPSPTDHANCHVSHQHR